jgi:predicted SAM-dependent methyltransferase
MIRTLRAKVSVSSLARSLSRRAKQLSIRRQVYRIRATGKKLKIIVGAGPTTFPGWISTDLPVLNALRSSDWFLAIPRSSVYRLLLEHVVEHWSEKDFRLFLTFARGVLMQGGFIRIAVPDGFHPDPFYINSVRPDGVGCGATDHKVIYNYKTLAEVLCGKIYAFRLVEYFDENAQFHCSKWKPEDGYVERSAAFDPRNAAKPFSYTSLIVDAWPQARVPS